MKAENVEQERRHASDKILLKKLQLKAAYEDDEATLLRSSFEKAKDGAAELSREVSIVLETKGIRILLVIKPVRHRPLTFLPLLSMQRKLRVSRNK